MTTWQDLAATARAGVVEYGATGTVEENNLNEIFRFLSIRPDDATLQDRLAEWGGCIYLSPISVDPDDSASGLDWQGIAPIVLQGEDRA